MKNKKKALILFGSPKENGFTAKVLNEYLNKIKDEYNFKIINSYEKNAKPCVDCGLCKIEDSCVYKDLDDFDELLRSSDMLIIATPVYNLSFPAPLKAILDRTQRYYSARFIRNVKPPIKKEKKGIIIITSGSDEDLGADMIIKQLKKVFSIINVPNFNKIIIKKTDKKVL